MTDAWGSIGMFAELTDPPNRKNMKRVDVRLPEEVLMQLESYAQRVGLSTSEVVRWLVVEGLERRGR
jgi:metal-responsive CopG/Arc/MetJ family transcriptional regulator